MKYLLVVSIVAICCVSGESDSRPPKVDFDSHFKSLSTNRYPFYENGEHWKQARYYIADKMRTYGAREIVEQVFNATVEDQEIFGVNLIGIVEGDSDNCSVIVVGADYDTGIVGNQLKNNAGGVAVLLETMHLFFDKIYWNQYHLNYTVIFVAFDLNTREYKNSGMGQPGSYFFIHEWLLPYLGNETSNYRDFRGAVILDSVTTYNAVNGTQHLREGFESAFPEAYDDIVSNGSKGDFLGLLYDSKEANSTIKNTFVSEFNQNITKWPFRLQEMEIHLGFDVVGNTVLDMINHQAHYNFWTNVQGRYLPAFLLFDTDDDRADPTPDACSEINCHYDQFLTDDRFDFLNKTTHALFVTLMRLQTTHYDEIPEDPDSATLADQSASFVLLATSICFALTRLLQS